MTTLRDILSESVREGELYEKLDRDWVRCFACGHCCKIPEGQPGVCKVRFNRGGTLYVPWGYGTPQVLEYLRPCVDLYKVDLKSFDDRHYRQLGGRLQPILETIRRLYEMGSWLEIVTLVIPGFNDSDDELTRLAEFLASVSADIPWHVTAFHKDYKMTDPENTSS